MPVWHERTKEWVKQGRLALLGVTQEQHADRCRLFAQWKRFDWPILHDPINALESMAVPIVVAIDEHGIVRAISPRPETFAVDFLDRDFQNDAPPLETQTPPGAADQLSLLRQAEENPSLKSWRDVGDAVAIWGGPSAASQAIDAYEKALSFDPQNALTRFRLGVAHRMRFETDRRREGDFQAAVTAWSQALELDPNQYIWRRRIEQYGPRLAKPYPFYDWVEQARAEISSRGEKPIVLAEEPYGSELASPSRGSLKSTETVSVEPDPRGRINRDTSHLIEAEVVVVPPVLKPGGAARIHLTFRPNALRQAFWNNESTPLRVWIDPAAGWQVASRLLEFPQPPEPESQEPRRLDFELIAPANARAGNTTLKAYALYNTCEQAGGTCQFVRQDFTINVLIRE